MSRTVGETWDLPENATLRLPAGIALVVRVERGTVLVTQEGDLDDHVLERGDELVLSHLGLAVAWAFTDAALSIQPGSTGWRREPRSSHGIAAHPQAA